MRKFTADCVCWIIFTIALAICLPLAVFWAILEFDFRRNS